MDLTSLLAGCAALVAVAGVVVSVVLVRAARRDRAVAEQRAESARAEAAALELRLAELTARVETLAGGREEAAYVITDAGRRDLDTAREPAPMLADRLVLSAAVGEPLVKAVALGHGVRRALSAESRHRIRFAMRQETRRARKQRRREMREVWLAHKRDERAGSRDEAARAA